MKRACAVAFCVIVLATTSVYAQPVVGVHFDIEPAALPGGAMGNAAPFIALMQKLKAVTNGVTQLSVDIPMGMGSAWTYNGRPIAQYVADIVDVVTVMSYRDHAAPTNGIIDNAQVFLDYAKKVGKKAVAGVETNCGVGDIVSFCEEGASYMEGQLGQVESTLRSYGSTYDGLAVHDYTGYSALAGSMKLPSSAPCRALWVWTHSVVTDSGAQSTFIDFCQRMRVCTVYIESQGLVDSSSRQPQLKAFVMALYNVGIKTELLFGNAEWTYTANHGQAIALAQATVNFIKSLPSGGGGGSVGTTGHSSLPSTTGTPSQNGGGVCGQKVVTKRYRVADGNDDVEEQMADNNYVYCTSSDLELTVDGSMVQTIGVRFQNVDISAQDTVVNAYLEMKSKSTQSRTTNLVIHGEKVENSGVLCDQSRPPTQRAHTNAQIGWSNIPKYTKGGIYQSPNVAPVVSEIVQQSGWRAGNAMSFFISGSGLRQMYSYNGGAAPYLVVQVQTVLCGQDYGNNDTDATTDWWAEDGVQPTADDSRDYNSANQVSAISALFLFSLCSLLSLLL